MGYWRIVSGSIRPWMLQSSAWSTCLQWSAGHFGPTTRVGLAPLAQIGPSLEVKRGELGACRSVQTFEVARRDGDNVPGRRATIRVSSHAHPQQKLKVGHTRKPPTMGTARLEADTPESGLPRSWVSAEELLGPLSEIERKFAPHKLFVAGKIGLPLPHPRVAIIGTRTPSDEGRMMAAKLSRALAQRRVIIVSGLARGIDTAAHTAAVEGGGRTIAVLGTPLSQTYPRENAELQSLIMRDHLAVSQFEEGRPVLRTNFVVRNRTMALIADASVIVESGDHGGSLHQGWEALRLGRPLFIHTDEFAKSGLEWPHKMAEYGAVRFKESRDIMDFVPSVRLNLAAAAFD